MKATAIKYLLLLEKLDAEPRAPQAELAEALDLPPSLVNRYVRRLAAWGALRTSGRNGRHRSLTTKGDVLRRRAAWEFLAFAAGPIQQLRKRAVRELRAQAAKFGARRVVLYGATPLAQILSGWVADAGLEVAALCDEERPGTGVTALDDLAAIDYDCFVLADWDKAEDALLDALLRHYAPVMNLFRIDGAAVPEWR